MSRRGECEVFGSGVDIGKESWAKWMKCEKNPGHHDFVDLKNLTQDHLPEEVRCQANLDWIKVISDLTVRIRVTMKRNNAEQCSGTGRILNVYPASGPCPCGIRFDRPCSKKWWGYNILTAKHVVCDTYEAHRTKVDLFYDDDSSGEEEQETLSVVKIFASSFFDDWCNFQAVSHDEKLAYRMNSHLLKFWSLRNQPDEWRLPYVVIVSHPHCQPKKVTIGRIGDRWRRGNHYNAGTCPGSSGAGVFPLKFLSYVPLPEPPQRQFICDSRRLEACCSEISDITRRFRTLLNDKSDIRCLEACCSEISDINQGFRTLLTDKSDITGHLEAFLSEISKINRCFRTLLTDKLDINRGFRTLLTDKSDFLRLKAFCPEISELMWRLKTCLSETSDITERLEDFLSEISKINRPSGTLLTDISDITGRLEDFLSEISKINRPSGTHLTDKSDITQSLETRLSAFDWILESYQSDTNMVHNSQSWKKGFNNGFEIRKDDAFHVHFGYPPDKESYNYKQFFW